MNNLIETITLAIVQGLTEFLPISSSAHLIIVPLLTGWTDQGLAFDIAVHLGTLLAVCFYFRKDLWRLWLGFLRSIQGHPSRFYSPLAWQLMAATFPIVLVGFFAHDIVATSLRSPIVIAFTTIIFGLILWASDVFALKTKKLYQLRWRDTLFIGFAQIFALIPGTSRSGITMTAGLALGYNRASSAKFAFLLSIPVIILAATYEGIHMLRSVNIINFNHLAIGIAFAAMSAYFCIHTFLLFIRKIGVLPFVIYRLLLGAFLLIMFL